MTPNGHIKKEDYEKKVEILAPAKKLGPRNSCYKCWCRCCVY
jgi:hypothetical protein